MHSILQIDLCSLQLAYSVPVSIYVDEILPSVDEIYSRVVRALSGCQNRTVLGSIPASSDTVESEGRQMKQC
jgi:hypothetical protein